jgi:hypothetical protein
LKKPLSKDVIKFILTWPKINSVIISIIASITFLLALNMVLNHTTKPGDCTIVRAPLGGEISSCQQPASGSGVNPLVRPTSSDVNKNGERISILTSTDFNPLSTGELSIIDGLLTRIELTPGNFTTKYLEGTWALTGTTSGNPVSAKVVFRDDNSYQIDGTINAVQANSQQSNAPNSLGRQNIPYQFSGQYAIDTLHQTLTLLTSGGVQNIYLIENVTANSFNAVNPATSEFLNFIRFSNKTTT